MISYTSSALIEILEILFSRGKVTLKCVYCLKTDWSVKRRDIGLVWELLALSCGLLAGEGGGGVFSM